MGKKGFHTPFEALKAVKLPAAPPPKPPPEPTAPPPSQSEERLFSDEMAGVAPLAPDPRGRLGAPEPTPPSPGRRRADDDHEVYAQLADLVEGVGPFDITDSDEYVEGLAPGIDRRLLRKLRRGDYAVQAHVDLHGLTSDEARAEVARFLETARVGGRRCVLIIHGRGLHSKDAIPVLKERVQVWLTRGTIARSVLAFATARPADGGAGAVYVLLRR